MSPVLDPLVEEEIAREAPADWAPEKAFHPSRPMDEHGQPFPPANAGKVNGGPAQPHNPLHRAKTA